MHISYFVDGYPDEVLYSMAARYALHLRLPSHMTLYEHWFGTAEPKAVIDFPTHLSHLAQALPPGHMYSVERLIDQHTLYPLYAAFLPKDRAQALRTGMCGAGQSLHWIAGTAHSSVPKPRWLRYCPQCVQADREQYGETYWHRCHQVPGVLVCPHHSVWLQESRVGIRSGIGQKHLVLHERFVAAERVVPALLSTPSDASIPQVLQAIGQNVCWLLHHRFTGSRLWICEQYQALLRQKGCVTVGGMIRHRTLVQTFYEQVPPEVLTLLHCELRPTGDSWLVRLLQPSDAHINHPLYHFLLMYVLGHTVQTFQASACSPHRPFGEGPWPCLNPLCRLYRERCISAYAVRSGDKRQPVATFICSCGYAYSRTGPDRTPEDSYRHGQISDYGHLWKQQLVQRWRDQTRSLGQIATEMHTTIKTIRRQAALLQLPFTPETPRRGKRPALYQDEVEKHREHHRAAWLSIQAEQPTAWLSQLVRLEPATHGWLKRHDAEWLSQHVPVEAEREMSKELAARERLRTAHAQRAKFRDSTLATEIRQAAQRIRERPEFPVRLTRATISREIGCVTLWNQERLPPHFTQARQALEEVTESFEEYVARRLEWTAQHYQEEQRRPSQPEFTRRAKLYWSLLQRPSIRSLAETVYQRSFGGRMRVP